MIWENRISVTISSSATSRLYSCPRNQTISSTRRICGLSCSISRGDSSGERLHLDLVDDRVEDALALPVAHAAEHGHDHALLVLRRLVAEPDRRGLASRAELIGDGGVVEVERERRHRRPGNYRGSFASISTALAAISRSPLYARSDRPVGEREPPRLGDLDLHSRGERADAAASRVREEEAHDLEDALPVPGVDVADVTELRGEATVHAGLLEPFPKGCLCGLLAPIDEALRQRPRPRRLALWPNRREPPAPAHPAHENHTGGEFAAHPDFVTLRHSLVTRI